jgi:hypothetical protein
LEILSTTPRLLRLRLQLWRAPSTVSDSCIIVTDGTSGSKDIYGHDLYFGKALGDQLRFLGATHPISNIHFTRLLLHGAGVVNAASGRTGARSGIAFQRRFSNVEVDHFYADGAQNSLIDFEPTGPATMTIEHAHVHILCPIVKRLRCGHCDIAENHH